LRSRRSATVAAEKRLHTAQPSPSRQMRDLEAELGCALMIRGATGIELTAAAAAERTTGLEQGGHARG
jgi:LysR family hca operon transcriptional activator